MLGLSGIIPTALSIITYYLAGRYQKTKQEERVNQGEITNA
jgi:hypothetical protein